MPAVSWYGIRVVCLAFLKVETLLDQLGTQFGGTTSDIVSRWFDSIRFSVPCRVALKRINLFRALWYKCRTIPDILRSFIGVSVSSGAISTFQYSFQCVWRFNTFGENAWRCCVCRSHCWVACEGARALFCRDRRMRCLWISQVQKLSWECFWEWNGPILPKLFHYNSLYLSYFIVKLSSDIFRLPILSNHFVHHEVLLKAAMRRTANGIRESTGKSREIEGQNREAQDLNFVDSNDLQPGTKVMLKSDLKAWTLETIQGISMFLEILYKTSWHFCGKKTAALIFFFQAPAFGWGGVNHQMVGIFLKKLDSTTVQVKWPTHPAWKDGPKGGNEGEFMSFKSHGMLFVMESCHKVMPWNDVISSSLCAYRFHSHRVTACELGDFPAFAGQIRRAQKGRCTSQQFGSSLCQCLSETLTGDMIFSNKTIPDFEVLDLRIRAVYPVQGGILADKIGYGKTARLGEKMGSNEKDGRKPSPDFFLLFCYVGLFDICLVCLISSLVCWLVGLLVS